MSEIDLKHVIVFPFEHIVQQATQEALESGVRQKVWKHPLTGWTWTEAGA